MTASTRTTADVVQIDKPGTCEAPRHPATQASIVKQAQRSCITVGAHFSAGRDRERADHPGMWSETAAPSVAASSTDEVTAFTKSTNGGAVSYQFVWKRWELYRHGSVRSVECSRGLRG